MPIKQLDYATYFCNITWEQKTAIDMCLPPFTIQGRDAPLSLHQVVCKWVIYLRLFVGLFSDAEALDEEPAFGFLLRVWIPSFFIDNGLFTCRSRSKKRINQKKWWRQTERNNRTWKEELRRPSLCDSRMHPHQHCLFCVHSRYITVVPCVYERDHHFW